LAFGFGSFSFFFFVVFMSFLGALCVDRSKKTAKKNVWKTPEFFKFDKKSAQIP